ncbi:MAG TPA: Ig-like domain-containing protein [Kofleriaceae bacterium]|nr:Ig-like domain-containing protein [Kofleriaceae bacterium]
MRIRCAWLVIVFGCSGSSSETPDAAPPVDAGSGADAAPDASAPVAPVTENAALDVEIASTATGRLVATDANGDALTYRIVTPPAKGTLAAFDPATGAFTYATTELVATTDSFTFQVSDGTADAATEGTVSVNILPFDFTGRYALENVTLDGQPCNPTSFTVDHHDDQLVIGDRRVTCGGATTTLSFQPITILPDRKLQSQGRTIGTLNDSTITIAFSQFVSGCGTVSINFNLSKTATGYLYSEVSIVPCISSDAIAATVASYTPLARLVIPAPVVHFSPTHVGTPVPATVELRNTGKVATTLTPTLASPVGFLGGAIPGTGGTCTGPLAARASCTVVLDPSAGPASCFNKGIGFDYTDGIANTAFVFANGCVSPVLTGVTDVAVGSSFFCAIHSGGLSCFGDNNLGQTTVPALTNPTRVFAGANHACALHAGGFACWGDNSSGQRNLPTISTPTQFALGFSHSCTLTSAVACFGSNSDQQVFPIPALVAPTAIASQALHTCAIDGTAVKCWGFGSGTPPAMTSPTAITTGFSHSCAIDAGVVRCWGDNSSGQTTVPPLVNPRAVAAVDNSTCALDDNGVTCWGNNLRGQTDVPPLAAPIDKIAGGEHACAIAGGGLTCW